jgi:hypothetical protein
MPKMGTNGRDTAARRKDCDEVTGHRESPLDTLRRGYAQQPSPEDVRKRITRVKNPRAKPGRN